MLKISNRVMLFVDIANSIHIFNDTLISLSVPMGEMESVYHRQHLVGLSVGLLPLVQMMRTNVSVICPSSSKQNDKMTRRDACDKHKTVVITTQAVQLPDSRADLDNNESSWNKASLRVVFACNSSSEST